MTIRIRPFTDADAEQVVAVHRAGILSASPKFYSQAERDSWAFGLEAAGYARARANGQTFIVAVDETDRPIGFCSYADASVFGLYVTPEYQGRGIGKALMAHAEADLLASGRKTLTLSASLSAVPFYQACGYRVLETVPHTSRGGLVMPSARMEKLCP